MNRLGAILAALCLCFTVEAQNNQATLPVKMLVVGEPLAPSEASHKGGDNWWALVKSDTGFALKKTTVTVQEQEYDAINEAGDTTGVKVESDLKESVLILIQGLPNPSPGPVEHIDLGKQGYFYPGYEFLFAFPRKSKHQTEWFIYATGSVVSENDSLVLNNYTLVLRKKGFRIDDTHQILTQYSMHTREANKNSPIIWIGDLDRDGQPDFLLNLAPTYITSEISLYLSSMAKEGELVGLAGKIEFEAGC